MGIKRQYQVKRKRLQKRKKRRQKLVKQGTSVNDLFLDGFFMGPRKPQGA